MLVGGRGKAVRRRGKPLVTTPGIEESDDRNQQCRCQAKREQPFRSASNDVCQVCDRSNVDYQFLMCAPAAPDASGAPQPAASSDGAPQPVGAGLPKRRSLTKKTQSLTENSAATSKATNRRNLLYRSGALDSGDRAILESFAVDIPGVVRRAVVQIRSWFK